MIFFSFLVGEVSYSPGALFGKAAKCRRQKVCLSKRPPKSEPRSVRPNEVFEKCMHVEFALKNREMVKAEAFEKRVFEQTAPLK